MRHRGIEHPFPEGLVHGPREKFKSAADVWLSDLFGLDRQRAGDAVPGLLISYKSLEYKMEDDLENFSDQIAKNLTLSCGRPTDSSLS